MKTQRELTKHSLKPKHRLKTQHINGNQTTKAENKVTNRQKQNKTKKPDKSFSKINRNHKPRVQDTQPYNITVRRSDACL